MTLWRIDDVITERQLSIFCHAAWFANREWFVEAPSVICYYTEHGVELATELAISHTIAHEPWLLPQKEIVVRGFNTYDYSLRPNENDAEVEGYWEAAASVAAPGQEPPDLMLITALRDERAENRSERYYRLSDLFEALRREELSDYLVIRFYGCRDIQND